MPHHTLGLFLILVLLKNNIKNQSDSIAILENKIKGFIQQYNNRMIENNLIVK